nr:MAK10-like protein [Tanacetum cinerariifolium]GEW27706.1 MAK10-like protein [Tanacetum cinerariifolium]
TRFKDLLQKVPYYGIDLWLQVQIFYDHVNPTIRRTIDQSAGSKLRDRNIKGSWALLEDLVLYDNESWNYPRDFAKLVKAISLPQDVSTTSYHHLIKLENQVQCLMEAHLGTKQSVQVKKITFSCEFYSGPHDTQYYMENPKQAFVDYASSRNNEVGESEVREEENLRPNAAMGKDLDITIEANEEVEEESKEEFKEETKEGEEDDPKYFDTFPKVDELRYHEWLLKNPRPS